jgi:hypothetical protein
MVSLNPLDWARGLLHLPALVVFAFVPDLKLVRDIPGRVLHRPTYGKEREVLAAATRLDEELRRRGRRAAFLLNCGDIVEDGRRPDQWRRFLGLAGTFASRVPYLPLPGNHDHTEDPRGRENWLVATGLPRWPDPLCYSFDSADGALRVLVLDSNPMIESENDYEDGRADSLAERQLDWLEERLAAHEGPSIVALHTPPYTAGRHAEKWQENERIRARRERLVETVRRSRTFLVIAGDEHSYQRAVLADGRDERLFVVSGGAGSPLHDLPNPTLAAERFAAYGGDAIHFPKDKVRAHHTFHFVHLRVWPGGAELLAHEVHGEGETSPIDRARITLGPAMAVTNLAAGTAPR